MMKKFELPYFGELDLDNVEEAYFADLDFHGREIAIGLFFDAGQISEVKMEKVKNYLTELEEYNERNQVYMVENYEENAYVREYIKEVLDEMGEDGVTEEFGEPQPGETLAQVIAGAMQLIGLAFSPNREKYFVTFDYSIGEDMTNSLLVLGDDEHEELNYFTIES